MASFLRSRVKRVWSEGCAVCRTEINIPPNGSLRGHGFATTPSQRSTRSRGDVSRKARSNEEALFKSRIARASATGSYMLGRPMALRRSGRDDSRCFDCRGYHRPGGGRDLASSFSHRPAPKGGILAEAMRFSPKIGQLPDLGPGSTSFVPESTSRAVARPGPARLASIPRLDPGMIV